jgi:hypothetical protein
LRQKKRHGFERKRLGDSRENREKIVGGVMKFEQFRFESGYFGYRKVEARSDVDGPARAP